MHQEIQDVLGQNFGIPDDIDEDELMEELDALEDDLTADTEANADGVPSYLQVLPTVSLQVLALLLSDWCFKLSFMNSYAWLSSSVLTWQSRMGPLSACHCAIGPD